MPGELGGETTGDGAGGVVGPGSWNSKPAGSGDGAGSVKHHSTACSTASSGKRCRERKHSAGARKSDGAGKREDKTDPGSALDECRRQAHLDQRRSDPGGGLHRRVMGAKLAKWGRTRTKLIEFGFYLVSCQTW